MHITYKHESDFKSAIINDDLLERAVEWIKSNIDPDTLFGEEELVEYVRDNYNPDKVFKDEVLEEWAVENGFTR